MMHEQACCCNAAANHQFLMAAAFWIIWIVSMEECSSLMQNLMQIRCSVILNVMATQYSYALNSIYRPHWLVQWRCPCARMHIPVHSPWLPGYVDVTQTVLVILTMTGLFPDRPHICWWTVFIRMFRPNPKMSTHWLVYWLLWDRTKISKGKKYKITFKETAKSEFEDTSKCTQHFFHQRKSKYSSVFNTDCLKGLR